MKQLRQKHKFLFDSIIFSALIAVIFSVLIAFLFFNNSTTLLDILSLILICLSPALLITLISFIGAKVFVKYPKATKIITGILITIMLLFQSLMYISIYCVMDLFSTDEQNYSRVEDYSKALYSIHKPICIKHFPQKIPQNAKNIEMEKSENSWFGSEEIFLKFDIDKKYIEDELKKYKFNYIEKYVGSDKNFGNYIQFYTIKR